MEKKRINRYDFSNRELYQFNSVYLETMNNKSRVLHFFGGAGSGKSVFVFQREIIKTYNKERKGYATMVCRQKYATLRKTCYEQIKKIIYDWNLQKDFKFYVQPLRIINLKTNVCFEFIGLDNPEDLKSLPNIDRFVVEEATDLKSKDTLDQISLRLRGLDKKDKQVVLLYNPVSINHWINTEIHEKINDYPDHELIKTTYLNNRFLDDESIALIERYKVTNPNYYRIYGLGNWGMPLEGLVYPDYEVYNKEDTIFDDNHQIFFGLDSGYNDATTMVKVIVNEEKKTCHIEEMFYVTKLTYSGVIQQILNCKDVLVDNSKMGWKTQIIYGDGQAKQLINSAREDKINIVSAYKGSGKKEIRIRLAKEYKIFVEGGSKNLLKEIGSYTWQKDNNGYSDIPLDGNDHALDAFLYALIRKKASNPFDNYKRFKTAVININY